MIAPIRRRRLSDSAERSRQAVLEAARSIIARGEDPSCARLGREAGLSWGAARTWRARLEAEGLIEFAPIKTGPKPGGPTTSGTGLTGETLEERCIIEARYHRERQRKLQALALGGTAELSRRVARVARYCGPGSSDWRSGGGGDS